MNPSDFMENPPPDPSPKTVTVETFPSLVDSSLLSAFAKCRRKGYWSGVRRLVKSEENIHTNAGGAYAEGLKVFRRSFYEEKLGMEQSRINGFKALLSSFNHDIEEVSQSPLVTSAPTILGKQPQERDSAKVDWINTAMAYLFYLEYFKPEFDPLRPHQIDGKHLVEFSFAIPLPIRNPQTGDPILYGGRFDMVGEMNGTLFVVDDKTTGAMGKNWANEWRLRGQITGYVWAAKSTLKLPIAGAIIRGVSIQKEANKYLQVPVNVSNWRIDRWYEGMIEQCNRLVQCWHERRWPTDGEINYQCSTYGACEYMRLCESPTPESWINGYYKIHKWSPVEES